jgi:hypothetical protein
LAQLTRSGEVTAIAKSLPSRMKGSTGAMPTMASGMWPATTSLVAGPAPL